MNALTPIKSDSLDAAMVRLEAAAERFEADLEALEAAGAEDPSERLLLDRLRDVEERLTRAIRKQRLNIVRRWEDRERARLEAYL